MNLENLHDSLLRHNEEYRLLIDDNEEGKIEVCAILDEICYDITRSPNHYRLRITKGKPPYNAEGSLVLGLNFLDGMKTSFIHEPFYFRPFPCLDASCKTFRKASFEIME